MREKEEGRNGIRKNKKFRELLLLTGLAVVLMFAVWKVFYPKTEEDTVTGTFRSENEQALSRLLAEIDGVGEVDVMIYEGETGEKKVVIVCDGANDIRVNAAVCEAAAAAVGTKETNVKVYQKKNK